MYQMVRIDARSIRWLVAAVLAFSTVALTPPASAHTCGAGEFHISGAVTDRSTGVPLDRVTSVGFSHPDGTPYDNQATVLPSSTFESCLPAGDYVISYFADEYYFEYFAASPTRSGAAIISGAPGDSVTGINASLIPYPVLTGRIVDSRSGLPLHTSVGIHQAGSGAGIDGAATDSNGVFWIVLDPSLYPVPGNYALSFAADSHWAEWYDGARRFSRSTMIVVTKFSGIIDGLDADLRPCGKPTADICVPKHFNN